MYVEIQVELMDSIGAFLLLAVVWVVQFRAILGSKNCIRNDPSDGHIKVGCERSSIALHFEHTAAGLFFRNHRH